MATTTPDALWSPDLGTAFVPVTDLAHMQDTVQTALNNKPINYRTGLDSGRTSPVGWTPTEGVKYYSTDTNREWFYDGAAWLPNDVVGQYLVRPTSVVNGTVSSDGYITPNGGATSLSVNGVFTSQFRKYRLDYSYALPVAAGSTLRMRNAGSDNSSAVYGLQQNATSGSTIVATSLANQAQLAVAAYNSLIHWGSIEFTNPARTGTNAEKILSGRHDGYLSQQIAHFSGILTGATGQTFDGFSYILSASSFTAGTGSFRIYGIN